MILDKLIDFKEKALIDIEKIIELNKWAEIKSSLVGKKSDLQVMLKDVARLPAEQRSIVGKQVNVLKQELNKALDEKKQQLTKQELESKLQAQSKDLSLPGWGGAVGQHHPLAIEMKRIMAIFKGFGFSVLKGPEIESEWYNFEALNIPKHHPARDMHDTFYTKQGDVLRTHTSPVQIRALQQYELPLKIIVPGRVFRCDADVTHSPVFHQCEGLYVAPKTSVAELKGVLEAFCRRYFGSETRLRFRSSYFPFTEPSFEVDISYKQDGKPSQWLEVLGAGMVHHNVLKAVNIDPEAYQGFAFGLGVDRLAMLRSKLYDIRKLYENDCRFNRQFRKMSL